MSVPFNSVRAALVASMLVAFATGGHAQSPWFGTWQVNLSKSTYPAGPPAFKRMTCRIESRDEQVRVTYDIIGTRGGVTHIEWTGNFDGRDYPVAGIEGYVVTHAYRLIDARTLEVVQKTEGSGTATARMMLSADGRTLTTLTPGLPTTTQTPVTTTVYDRQAP